ncbi:MAG: hypothetical protein ACFFG0_02675 [Candidatus Thorarchaeota archaeon]
MKNKIDIVERLNRDLNIKERDIEKKEYEIEKLKFEVDNFQNMLNNVWMLNKVNEKSFDLPTPRLEMRFKTIGYTGEWIYGIVFMPYWEIKDKELFLPISMSSTTNPKAINFDIQESFLPFRDGLHIKHDSVVFKLPAFFINEDEHTFREIRINEEDVALINNELKRKEGDHD